MSIHDLPKEIYNKILLFNRHPIATAFLTETKNCYECEKTYKYSELKLYTALTIKSRLQYIKYRNVKQDISDMWNKHFNIQPKPKFICILCYTNLEKFWLQKKIDDQRIFNQYM